VEGNSLLIDDSGTVGKAYGAELHQHVRLNKATNLFMLVLSDDKSTTDAEDVPKAHNYVKAALDEAMGGKKIATTSSKQYGCSVKYIRLDIGNSARVDCPTGSVIVTFATFYTCAILLKL